jgi:flagellar protein FliO/FliZ
VELKRKRMRYTRYILMVGMMLGLLGLARTASAQTTMPSSEARSVSATSRPSPESELVEKPEEEGLGIGRTVLALAVVVALIFITRAIVRRCGGACGVSPNKGPLEIVHRVATGPRQQLLMVRLGRRMLLIGATPERLTYLTEVSDEQEPSSKSSGENAKRTEEKEA